MGRHHLLMMRGSGPPCAAPDGLKSKKRKQPGRPRGGRALFFALPELPIDAFSNVLTVPGVTAVPESTWIGALAGAVTGAWAWLRRSLEPAILLNSPVSPFGRPMTLKSRRPWSCSPTIGDAMARRRSAPR
jgi:hypothetical protein